jgi:hypothetical protein
MKVRKSKPEWTKDTEGLGRKNQVIITRIRRGYTRATPSYIIEKRDNNDSSFCNTKPTVEHILWRFKKVNKTELG